jgi:hypothetical protein
MSQIKYFAPKTPDEVIWLGFDYSDVLGVGEHVVSATWKVTSVSDITDADLTAMMSGSVDLGTPPIAKQLIQGGTPGTVIHQCTLVTDQGRTLVGVQPQRIQYMPGQGV